MHKSCDWKNGDVIAAGENNRLYVIFFKDHAWVNYYLHSTSFRLEKGKLEGPQCVEYLETCNPIFICNIADVLTSIEKPINDFIKHVDV